MSKTAKAKPAPKKAAAAKTGRKTSPGMRRLKANPAAESIRSETLADQNRARREARAKIEAAPLTGMTEAEAIELAKTDHDLIETAEGVLIRAEAAKIEAAAKAPETPARAPRARRAAKAPAEAAKPASAHATPGGKRAAMLESAQAGVLPAVPNFEAETHKRFRPPHRRPNHRQHKAARSDPGRFFVADRALSGKPWRIPAEAESAALAMPGE